MGRRRGFPAIGRRRSCIACAVAPERLYHLIEPGDTWETDYAGCLLMVVVPGVPEGPWTRLTRCIQVRWDEGVLAGYWGDRYLWDDFDAWDQEAMLVRGLPLTENQAAEAALAWLVAQLSRPLDHHLWRRSGEVVAERLVLADTGREIGAAAVSGPALDTRLSSPGCGPSSAEAVHEASVEPPTPLPGPEESASAVGQFVVGHRGNPLVSVRESGLVLCAVETDRLCELLHWPGIGREVFPAEIRPGDLTGPHIQVSGELSASEVSAQGAEQQRDAARCKELARTPPEQAVHCLGNLM